MLVLDEGAGGKPSEFFEGERVGVVY